MSERYILSNTQEDKLRFEEMIDETISSFFNTLTDDKAFSGINPYELRDKIRGLGFLPEKGIGFEEALSVVRENILPHLLRTWSTCYMPHLHSPSLLETICAELLIAIYNDSMDSWDQGPAATEVEESMIDGLKELFGYGENAGGVFTSGGSQSNMSALIAHRDCFIDKNYHWDTKKKGLPPFYNKLRMYTSEISHFSMEKSSHIMGLGYDAVRKVPVDEKCKLDTVLFEKMVEEDINGGYIPFLAVATIGTTDFGSIDNVSEMRRICDKYGMYLHSDAAYGSGAIMSKKYAPRLGDIALSDSITVDFHKMFLLPISSSAILMKDRSELDCFLLHADYLNREEDEEDGYVNLVDKSMQTTRRFDALKVFFAFQVRGREGYDELISHVIENAEYFYSLIKDDDDFIVPIEPELSSVVFALNKWDENNKKVRRKLMEEGTVIGQTTMNGRVMLKFTLLNPNLEKEDFIPLIERIKRLGEL